jgi:hypothetical protein
MESKMEHLLSTVSMVDRKLEALVGKNWNHLLVVTLLVYILCAMNLPVSIYTLAGHDDGLFISNAYSILNGEWLGSYSQMTLAKGAGYSLFLAINAASGIPITLSLALFFAFAAWLLTEKLTQLGLSKLMALILFILLLFHPHLFPTRIIRDNIYPALSLLVFTALIDLCFLNQRRWFILFLYGCTIALFWITREEGVWMIPALALLVLFKLWSAWREGKDKLVIFIKSVALLMLFISLPLLIICSINYAKYGAFLTVDFKDPAFSKSLSLLNSIEVDTKISHVPVNKQQREAAYSISPAFAELKTYFEETGTGWTKPGCNIYPDSCGDYAGGWFMWAYRDAVQNRGNYQSFTQASTFYQRVATEISSACDTGKIACKSGLFGFLPKLNAAELSAIPDSLINSYKLITLQTPVQLDAGPSMYADGRLDSVKLFLRNPLIVPSIEEDTIRMSGWYYNPLSSDLWVDVECPDNSSTNITSISRIHSPDIAIAMNNSLATKQRFSIKTTKQDGCRLIDTNKKSINIDHIHSTGPGAFAIGDATLFIDSMSTAVPPKLKKVAATIKINLANIYKSFLPLLFWLGLIALLTSFLLHVANKTRLSPILVCAFVAWTLVCTRVGILILIDVSSFPAINSLYMGPAFPLLLAAIILSLFSLRYSVTPLLRN